MKNKYPRLLAISNNCFSKTNSNGRTLGNFFKSYKISNLAQFYIQNEAPDFDICENYFRVTDKEVLLSYIKRTEVGAVITNHPADFIATTNATHKRGEKNPISFLIRNIIWNSNCWQGQTFKNWLEGFNPEIVLLQAGDSEFMLKLATKIATDRNIPLLIYNSEDYCFKKKNFMKSNFFLDLFYPIFRYKLKRQYDKTLAVAAHSIYICDALKKLYDNEYSCPGTTIMTSTDIKPVENKPLNQVPVVSYLGNLGVGRHEPLIEIADTLQRINSDCKLDIYGKIPNEDIKQKFESCNGINYKGFVNYDEVVSIMQKSDLLIHVENFSDFYREDLKYAFSTKISDSLACGTCFFVYAPLEIASIKYLIDNQAACVVTKQENLQGELERILFDKEKRNNYISKAKKVVEENNDSKKNQVKFLNIVSNIYGGSDFEN